MTDLNQSLDSTIAAIRAAHADELQAYKDRALEAEVRAELLQSHLTEARNFQASAERLAVKLVTQFSVVEQVFAEAKALAQAAYAAPASAPQVPTPLPANNLAPGFAEAQAKLEAKTQEITK